MKQNEKRTYQRGDHFECTARISEDGETWFDAIVEDLSSGGLLFRFEKEYKKGSVLWFNVLIEGFFSEFRVKIQGKVCRVQHSGKKYAHGIAFIGMDKDTKIRIDENVLSVKRLGIDYSDSLDD